MHQMWKKGLEDQGGRGKDRENCEVSEKVD